MGEPEQYRDRDYETDWGQRLVLACIIVAAIVKLAFWINDPGRRGARTSEALDQDAAPEFYDGNHASPPLYGDR